MADGMGGHSHGEVASHMVTDALGVLSLSGGLEARTEQARRALGDVNRELRRLARTRTDDFDAGSTVVALVACGMRAAAIWAGDSRAYRIRDGVLEPITSDHSENSTTEERSNVITRAVGAFDDFETETRFIDLLPGDRFLLCSDGIHGEVTADQICLSLNGPWNERVAAQLLDQVMTGAARDNATAVVVECEGHS